jgi:hypothetical protein
MNLTIVAPLRYHYVFDGDCGSATRKDATAAGRYLVRWHQQTSGFGDGGAINVASKLSMTLQLIATTRSRWISVELLQAARVLQVSGAGPADHLPEFTGMHASSLSFVHNSLRLRKALAVPVHRSCKARQAWRKRDGSACKETRRTKGACRVHARRRFQTPGEKRTPALGQRFQPVLLRFMRPAQRVRMRYQSSQRR